MRFEKLYSKIKAETLGLKPVDLTQKRLGALVALVGKNGAGKSRILKVVENYFLILTEGEFLNDYVTHIPQNLLKTEAENISSAKTYGIPKITPGQKEIIDPSAKKLLSGALTTLMKSARNYIKVVNSEDLINIKDGIENGLKFEELLQNLHAEKSNLSDLTEKSQISVNEFNWFNTQETVRHLNDLSQDNIAIQFNQFIKSEGNEGATEQGSQGTVGSNRFNRFRFFLEKFLGKKFSHQTRFERGVLQSTLLMNGKKFDIKLLSPGQKTLFAYAVLLYYMEFNSKSNTNESIIIIDEPEKHLHPEAQILLIDTLKDIVKNRGQLWIATHSINILSHLEADEIFLVDNDEIFPPSRTIPGKSFGVLMGLEKHIEELQLFINSISHWAYANFMSQCFKEPDVVFANETKDPQYQLFLKFLSDYQELSILDYGAGKGRIGYTIQEDSAIKSKVKYSAFEPDKGNFELLSKVPEIVKFTDKIEEIKENSMDCVLLCNVLHEIHPEQWPEVMTQAKRVLKQSGYLLILEDKYLPKGESAHEFGYLILGINQIKELIGSSSDLINLELTNPAYKDRIVFCAIPRRQISTSSYNVRRAISSLEKDCFNELKKLRAEKGKDTAQGRQYANLTQLYINSKMASEKLGSSLF